MDKPALEAPPGEPARLTRAGIRRVRYFMLPGALVSWAYRQAPMRPPSGRINQ